MDRAKAVATQCCSSRESVRPCSARAVLNEMRNFRGEASWLVPEEVHAILSLITIYRRNTFLEKSLKG